MGQAVAVEATPKAASSRPGSTKPTKAGKQGSGKNVKAPLKQVAAKKSADSDESGRSTPEQPKDPKAPENQKIKNETGDNTPFWKKGPSEFRPTSSRPMSTAGGKLLVYKTEKQKQIEEQARLNRAASGDVFSNPASRPGSALPPLADRKKLSMKAKELTGEVRASNGGAAWAMEL
eukprot:CAMPEP_0117048396 /NCGR_PEP_ID=MMETSP0472-20121206/33451_1 /TAXON_ID=693140 ORGANISM="Tiarina fusus, Strain LIS" /NCGR_SAMPLE_ID=MMETSP0472 /ASSEMBLY_ACC=CAM_ASM_000603 /LENGTH=175 /DNA_ID=CAMNT_0004761473 /DNA_START=75 /DNA_END=603 /DNA_ORIENTATION=+